MEGTTIKHRKRTIAGLISGTLLAFTFWAVPYLIDIYKYAVAGAIFEMAWLPMLAVTFGAPLVSFYFWAKERFKINSVFLYLLLLSALSIYIMTTRD